MSTYSPSLRIELIPTGDQAGTWGVTTNTNLGTLIESAIAGYTSVSITSANQAFTALNGVEDQSRNAVIALTTTTTAAFNVYAPPAEKTYVIYNASAYAATIYNSTVLGNTTAAGAGVTVPAGKTMTVWTDGTSFAAQNTHTTSMSLGTPLAVADGGTGATTAAGARTALAVPSLTGTGASGSWAIDITGSAATATTATTAGSVTNGVYTVGDQTIGGTKTLSANPILDAGTANGVAYLNASKSLTSGAGLVFNGTNLGVGAPPSAWASGYRVLELNGAAVSTSGSASNINVGANWYVDTGGYMRYVASQAVGWYQQNAGGHIWYSAPPGSAGATTAAVTGRVYTVTTLGSTTLAQWQALFSGVTSLPSVGAVVTATSSGTLAGGATVTQIVTLSTNMALDSDGNLGIGITSPQYKLHVNGNAAFASTGAVTLRTYRNAVVSAADTALGVVRFTSDGSAVSLQNSAASIQSYSSAAWSGASSPGDLRFYTTPSGSLSDTERLRINSSGNMGLGVVPNSAWTNTIRAFQIGTQGALTAWLNDTVLSANWYNDGTSNKYIGTGRLSRFFLSNGQFTWDSAASGTAGATATITTMMVLDTAGDLFLRLDGSAVKLRMGPSGDTYFGYDNNANAQINATSDSNIRFTVGASEKVRIDALGNLLIGTTTAGAAQLVVSGDSIQINTAKTPASATAAGTTGQIAWNSSYIYVCVATNTWKRAALASW